MIRAGFTFQNPITQSVIRVLETDLETNGMGWLLEIRCAAKMPPDIVEHLHLDWTETFEILSGTAHYKLNGEQKLARAGETIVMPAGQKQIHPWNAGEDEMIYRQRNQFAKSSPEAVQDVLGVFATTAYLASQGKIDKDGKAKNPLQLAATLRVLSKHGGYDASIPVAIQNVLSSTVGVLAEWLGYKAIIPAALKS
jgi:Cupin domain